ncbi:hypothetical protein JCM8547_000970 [Rhodosporidiobolus lusitaniae]
MAGGGLSSHLTSILCWTFIPSLLTNLVISTFYRLLPSYRPVVPPNASPTQLASENARAQSHYRRARVALLSAYLVYSVLSVYWSQGGRSGANYYALLGLPRDVVETEGGAAVKKHWKKLARVYHPDKVGKGGEALFVELKKGVDALQDDGKRWAYERFGPGVTSWGGGKLVTNREFLKTGAIHSTIFWGSAILSIFVFAFFRKSERRYNFWRYLSLALCMSLEFHFLLRPFPSPTFSLLFPSRLTFEHISLLRQIFISSSLAMSQITPLLFPTNPSLESAGPAAYEEDALARAFADADQLKPLLQRLVNLTTAAEAEAAALQALELRPLFVPSRPSTPSEGPPSADPAREKAVREKLQQDMVRTFEDLQVKSIPATAAVWRSAVMEAREKGGAGKEGKKDGKKEKRKKKKAAAKEGGAKQNGDVEAGEKKEERRSRPSSISIFPSSSSIGSSGPSPSPSLISSISPAPPTLDTATIPPSIVALASPPASPRLRAGFPLGAIPLPSPGTLEAAEKIGREGMRLVKEEEGGEAGKKKVEEKTEKQKKEESRLLTPPPE